MIDTVTPSDWQGLEESVARILAEAGMAVERRLPVKTVRGEVEIDVFAIDNTQPPPTSYIIECKHWQSPVPQTIVHAFRTVVSDYGANWGLIVSSSRFQSGSFDAVQNSNIKLLDWSELQTLFERKWFDGFFAPTLKREADRLDSYMKLIDKFKGRRMRSLSADQLRCFEELCSAHADLAFLLFSLTGYWDLSGRVLMPILPLRTNRSQEIKVYKHLPKDIVEASSLRGFLDCVTRHGRNVRQGLNDFLG